MSLYVVRSRDRRQPLSTYKKKQTLKFLGNPKPLTPKESVLGLQTEFSFHLGCNKPDRRCQANGVIWEEG